MTRIGYSKYVMFHLGMPLAAIRYVYFTEQNNVISGQFGEILHKEREREREREREGRERERERAKSNNWASFR